MSGLSGKQPEVGPARRGKMFKAEFTQSERDTILIMIAIAEMIELPNDEARHARLGMQPDILSVIEKLTPPGMVET